MTSDKSTPTDPVGQVQNETPLTREQLITWATHRARTERVLVAKSSADALDAIAAMLTVDAELLRSAVELKRIAREAINSWACVARANRDFDYIGSTHRALDAISLPSTDTSDGAQ